MTWDVVHGEVKGLQTTNLCIWKVAEETLLEFSLFLLPWESCVRAGKLKAPAEKVSLDSKAVAQNLLQFLAPADSFGVQPTLPFSYF